VIAGFMPELTADSGGQTIKKDPVLTGPNISGECMGQSRRDLQIETPHALAHVCSGSAIGEAILAASWLRGYWL
jgi:hypothetical protein